MKKEWVTYPIIEKIIKVLLLTDMFVNIVSEQSIATSWCEVR